MIKVILKTGEVIEVTKNEAHGLIESKKGKLFKGENKMMMPEDKKKGYKTK